MKYLLLQFVMLNIFQLELHKKLKIIQLLKEQVNWSKGISGLLVKYDT